MTPLQYNFERKIIWENEPPRAVMTVEKPYAMLTDLGNSLDTLEVAKEALAQIKKVVSGKLRKFEFGSDSCMLEVYKRTTNIHYKFGEVSANVETEKLVGLIGDWVGFLGT
jgi:hypothetical protein